MQRSEDKEKGTGKGASHDLPHLGDFFLNVYYFGKTKNILSDK